jgi:ABC-type phosphate transport system substrate-binding protein
MRAIVALVVALVLSPPRADPEPRYRLIVHIANPVRALAREDLSRLFLKKETRWPDGTEAMPVDLADGFAARESFSRHVHRKSVRAIKAYWQQMIFSGRAAPPPEMATEADVIALVRSNPNAVGYVSDEALLSGVKVLEVLDAPRVPAAARN